MTFTSTRTGSELRRIDLWGHVERLLKEYSASANGRIASETMGVNATATGDGPKVQGVRGMEGEISERLTDNLQAGYRRLSNKCCH